MKKIVLFLIISVLFIVSLSAFSWEGLVDVNMAFTGPTNNISLGQTDELTMSFKAPIKSSIPMYITGSGSYAFEYQKELTTEAQVTEKAVISNLLDISLLKYNVNFGDISIDAGRFPVSDITGIIISQPIDAAKVTYFTQKVTVNAYAGFTGFLNSHTVDINAAPNEKSESEIYALAAPFFVTNVMFGAPRLFANQDLFGEVLATIDAGNSETPNSRIYGNLALTGPLSNSLYYTVASSIGVIQNEESKWDVSNLSSLELTTFFPYGSSMLSWKTVFASANETSRFETFTAANASIDGSVPYGGYLKTGLVGTIRPIDTVMLFLAPDIIFNVMNDDMDKGYAGFQWMFNAKYTATSDLDIVASVSQFISSVKDEKPYLNANIGLSFRF